MLPSSTSYHYRVQGVHITSVRSISTCTNPGVSSGEIKETPVPGEGDTSIKE